MWQILPMQRRHLPALAELEILCFSEPWSEAGLLEELENENACFLVCEDAAGHTAGYCGCHFVLDEGAITNIAVFPSHRGQGAGTALLDALETAAAAHGVRQITLEVRPSNAAAIALYERFGYRLAGMRRGFYRAPAEDGCIYRKELPEQRAEGEEDQ